MRLLLDTHIFLWFVSGNQKLAIALREAIGDPQNEIFLSVVSLWEIIIKYQLGHLPLPRLFIAIRLIASSSDRQSSMI